MSATVSLEDVRRALEARDPSLAYLVIELAASSDPQPTEPVREGALTWEVYQRQLGSWEFRRKPREEQRRYRVETLQALEAAGAEVPLPDRLRLHAVLMELWADDGAFARQMLLEIFASVALRYGVWRAMKRIFKDAEARGDWEIFGALVARLDREFALGWSNRDVTRQTLGYMVRRGWRALRQLGRSMPVAYADAAASVLAHYTEDTNWTATWVSNHVFYHETKKYNRGKFRWWKRPSTLLKYRAFGDLWQRSPRPLFSLLERAKADQVRRYAVDALKSDFRTSLREVEASWVARLVGVHSEVVDDFVVWVLGNVPRFEQAAFRELGLHEAVLSLFDSSSSAAREYAAGYARAHARDLPLAELIRLANNTNTVVHKLAVDLLSDLDPRKDVGLDAWGQLLENDRSFEFASKMLRKHFGARELSPAWFKARLLSDNRNVVGFAEQVLPIVHPWDKLGAAFFVDLLEERGLEQRAATFATSGLARFDVKALDLEFLRRLIVNPMTRWTVCTWIDQGKLEAEALGADFVKILAFHLDWESSPWMAALKASGRPWARELDFDAGLSSKALAWLGDVRRFSPEDLGFGWLMRLAMRSELSYHEFAVETMIKSFLPADFAEKDEEPEAPAAAEASGEINVDLGGASILFTGKLATMTRSEAEKKVQVAGGTVAKAVARTLDYLVIGDEGSPLYGAGRKGSKQVGAEKLIAAGSPMKIISETAFLQMLAGEQREFSADDVQSGCERLWTMATAAGDMDEPLRQFALRYMRRHHQDIGLELTDRPVDPGAEIPASFLTFEQVKPLFVEERKGLREFGLELARWELARWNPPIEALVELAECSHLEVREFVAKALLADATPEHARYRIDPSVLTADAVYQFCESNRDAARALGMTLIDRHPRLQIPEELFRLTESPDRRVRAFVIRTIWGIYRDRGATSGWKPTVTEGTTLGRKKEPKELGPGSPARPETLPASHDELLAFLRRILFEIPPAKLDKRGRGQLRPMPARKAKLALVDVLRDLAVADAAFATVVFPLLAEFMGSRGQSEMAACLVATTRIRKAHPAAVTAMEA